MKANHLALRSCSAFLSLTLLFGLSSCGSSTPTSSASASEDAIVASSVAEPPLSVTHPFVHSTATWSTTPAEIETVMERTPDKISLVGNGKKAYVFDNTECNTLRGFCSFTFKDDLLCKTYYNYTSTKPFTDASTSFVDNLKETYGDPTEDKSDLAEDGAGVWLEWLTDDGSISYFYLINTDNKYELTLAYELSSDKIPPTDASDRNGDFRIGFWGDDMETINKYETTKFEGISEEDDDTTMMMYSGTVSGRSNTYITYLFDSAGKLYQCFYGFNDTYSGAELYIAAYKSLKESLTEKYGKPASDERKNLSSLARYADEDVALQLGYSAYRAVWKTETTEITLIMYNLGDGIETTLAYTDPNHEEIKDTSGL